MLDGKVRSIRMRPEVGGKTSCPPCGGLGRMLEALVGHVILHSCWDWGQVTSISKASMAKGRVAASAGQSYALCARQGACHVHVMRRLGLQGQEGAAMVQPTVGEAHALLLWRWLSLRDAILGDT